MGHFDQFVIMLSQYGQEGHPARPLHWPEALREMLATRLDEPQGIQALSDQLSLHRVAMARGFKKQYGLSPVQFRTYTRIIAAVQALALSQKSLTAIAYDCGFADQPHLTRAFKSLMGCTPGEYRKMIQQADGAR